MCSLLDCNHMKVPPSQLGETPVSTIRVTLVSAAGVALELKRCLALGKQARTCPSDVDCMLENSQHQLYLL